MPRTKPFWRVPRNSLRWLAPVLASTLIGIAIALVFYPAAIRGHATDWQLSFAGRQPMALRTGQTIETGAAMQATMQSESVGEVLLAPESRLRLLASSRGQQRFALDYGTMHALIWAPPQLFVVDTPSAKTIDLGCQYTLRMARDGTGLLTVETGWVAFQWHNLESFIPAGAACITRSGRGPGTPYFVDAPKAMTTALAQYDMNRDPAALTSALAGARKRDALTLWHLLTRTQGAQRSAVFDRFSALVVLPETVTRDSILRSDPKALDAAWDALDLENTSWWREWKRQW